MSTLEILALTIIVVVLLLWRITWLASRLHRANARAERAWSALDAALVGRAQRAAELIMMPGIDPPQLCWSLMRQPLHSSRTCAGANVSAPRATSAMYWIRSIRCFRPAPAS
jgi:hypothetical protein